jgi:hypothetical protein
MIGLANNALERICKETIMVPSHHPSIGLKELRNTMKTPARIAGLWAKI